MVRPGVGISIVEFGRVIVAWPSLGPKGEEDGLEESWKENLVACFGAVMVDRANGTDFSSQREMAANLPESLLEVIDR